MLKGRMIFPLVAGFLGFTFGAVAMYGFYARFVDQSLNARFSTELAQDIFMYDALRKGDYPRASSLLRIRMAGNVVGLQGQCSHLSTAQKNRSKELFQKLRDMQVDASVIPVSLDSKGPIESCPD